MTKAEREAIRIAFSEYVNSEGCSCCQDSGRHHDALHKMGKLLKMKPYSDGSGYDTNIPTPKQRRPRLKAGRKEFGTFCKL